MPTPIPAEFPLILGAVRRPETVRDAIDVLRRGQVFGTARSVDLAAARTRLGRAVEEAWTRQVAEPYFHAGRWSMHSTELRALHDACSPSSLHDVLLAHRKLSASPLEGPVMSAMRELIAEALPLAEVARDLRDSVTKGRVAAPPRPANPDQVRGTCSCCFRDAAVLETGHMAHHGYQRPGYGVQTSSCAGTRFPPLEVSVEGLEWLVENTTRRLDETRAQLDRAAGMDRLHLPVMDRGRMIRKEFLREDPDWAKALSNWTRMTAAWIGSESRHLDDLNGKLDHWRARHASGVAPAAPAVDPDSMDPDALDLTC